MYATVLVVLLLFTHEVGHQFCKGNLIHSVKSMNCSKDHSMHHSMQHKSDHSCFVNMIRFIGYDELKHVGLYLDQVRDQVGLHKLEVVGSGVSASSVGSMIDAFLTTSPWWILNKETYDHPVLPSSSLSSVSSVSSSSSSSVSHSIVLHRMKPEFESRMRRISSRQYPSQTECESTPLFIGRMINSGWGSQFYMFTGRAQWFGNSVFNVWYTRNNGINESMQVCNAEDCNPNRVNKWECVFLPLTNCSLEHVSITHCHKPVNHPTEQPCFPMEAFKVRNMSREGGGVAYGSDAPEYDAFGRKPNAYQRLMDKQHPINSAQDWLQSRGFINGAGAAVPFPVHAMNTFYGFGLIFRPNYNLRRRVQVKIRELQQSGAVPYRVGAESCVAIHIRRGDRIVPGVDMRDYCHVLLGNGTLTRNTCTDQLLSQVPVGPYRRSNCATLNDLGCFGTPFGAFKLVDYLHRARQVYANTSNVFVMTDDGPWLEKEIQLLSSSKSAWSRYQVGYLPAQEESRAETRRDHQAANYTRYSVDFWTSIAIARTCQGFVGHFGSGVASFVYAAMCYQHGEQSAKCPYGGDMKE